MNLKNILLGAVAVIGTFILLFFVYKLTNPSVASDTTTTVDSLLNQASADDHVRWKKDSKNILVEYSDFQCPACRNLQLLLEEIEKTATPNAALVFRNFPLYQIHPTSFVAAYAVEAAGQQNKYWEMNHAVFDRQSEWAALEDPSDYFVKLAKKLNLNIDQFNKDIISETVKTKVENDLKGAEKLGLNATPTFFLNGKQLELSTIEDFKNLLKSL